MMSSDSVCDNFGKHSFVLSASQPPDFECAGGRVVHALAAFQPRLETLCVFSQVMEKSCETSCVFCAERPCKISCQFSNRVQVIFEHLPVFVGRVSRRMRKVCCQCALHRDFREALLLRCQHLPISCSRPATRAASANPKAAANFAARSPATLR